jgi:hypothetical protein
MLQLAGILIVIVFWVSDERAGKYWLNCVQRAETLEKELGFEQYSPPTQAGLFASSRGAIVTVGNALRLLFTVLFLFWGSLVISTLTEVV